MVFPLSSKIWNYFSGLGGCASAPLVYTEANEYRHNATVDGGNGSGGAADERGGLAGISSE